MFNTAYFHPTLRAGLKAFVIFIRFFSRIENREVPDFLINRNMHSNGTDVSLVSPIYVIYIS